jgi:hypothetical protein
MLAGDAVTLELPLPVGVAEDTVLLAAEVVVEASVVAYRWRRLFPRAPPLRNCRRCRRFAAGISEACW